MYCVKCRDEMHFDITCEQNKRNKGEKTADLEFEKLKQREGFK